MGCYYEPTPDEEFKDWTVAVTPEELPHFDELKAAVTEADLISHLEYSHNFSYYADEEDIADFVVEHPKYHALAVIEIAYDKLGEERREAKKAAEAALVPA